MENTNRLKQLRMGCMVDRLARIAINFNENGASSKN